MNGVWEGHYCFIALDPWLCIYFVQLSIQCQYVCSEGKGLGLFLFILPTQQITLKLLLWVKMQVQYLSCLCFLHLSLIYKEASGNWLRRHKDLGDQALFLNQVLFLRRVEPIKICISKMFPYWVTKGDVNNMAGTCIGVACAIEGLQRVQTNRENLPWFCLDKS